jgi:small-conductance mechanosensitive channel
MAGWGVARLWEDLTQSRDVLFTVKQKGNLMNNIIYIVGLVVVVIAVLSFFGLG